MTGFLLLLGIFGVIELLGGLLMLGNLPTPRTVFQEIEVVLFILFGLLTQTAGFGFAAVVGELRRLRESSSQNIRGGEPPLSDADLRSAAARELERLGRSLADRPRPAAIAAGAR